MRAGAGHPVLVVVLLGVMSAITGMAASVMSVGYPSIVRAFPESAPEDLSWITNSYTIVGGALLVPAGVLAERWGRREMVLAGLALFAAGAVLGGVARVPWLLIVARTVQAVGAAAFIPAGAALMIAAFAVGRSAMAISVWAATGGIGAAMGPVLGGLVIDQGGWPWIFWINVPICAVALVGGALVFPPGPRVGGGALPDPLGAVLVMAAISAVTLGVVQSGSWGWLSGRTLGCIALGMVLAGALVARSAHHPRPVLDLTLFRLPAVRWSNLGTIVYAGAYFALHFGIVLYTIQAWGWTALRAGAATCAVPALSGVGSLVVGRVAHRTGHRPFILPGLVAFAVSAAWLWATIGAEPDLWGAVVPGSILLGLSTGLVFPSMIAGSVHGVDGPRHAVATGVNFTAQRTGTALGVALAVAFLAGTTSPSDFGRVCAVAIAGAAITLVVALRIDTRGT